MRLSKLAAFLNFACIDFGDPGNSLNSRHPRTTLELLSSWRHKNRIEQDWGWFLESFDALLEFWVDRGIIDSNPLRSEAAKFYLPEEFLTSRKSEG
ncbi:MAG: hypothetical protein AAF558_14535 [Verrucomicrobiota bacterium]